MGVPAALALVGGVGAGMLLSPRYRASTSIRAHWGVEGVSRRTAAELDARRLQSMRQQILNRSSVEAVLRDDPPPPRDGVPMQERVDTLLASVRVEARGEGVFAIECVHRDPKRAAVVCDGLAKLLVERAQGELTRGSCRAGLPSSAGWPRRTR